MHPKLQSQIVFPNYSSQSTKNSWFSCDLNNVFPLISARDTYLIPKFQDVTLIGGRCFKERNNIYQVSRIIHVKFQIFVVFPFNLHSGDQSHLLTNVESNLLQNSHNKNEILQCSDILYEHQTTKILKIHSGFWQKIYVSKHSQCQQYFQHDQVWLSLKRQILVLNNILIIALINIPLIKFILRLFRWLNNAYFLCLATTFYYINICIYIYIYII